MTDIVKRLYEESQEVTDSLYYQAADTIEQLRAELTALRKQEPVAIARTPAMGSAVFSELPAMPAVIGEDIYLYTTPPPAIPESRVPEAISPGDWPGDPTPAFADGWNACRDAMLAAQQEKNDD